MGDFEKTEGQYPGPMEYVPPTKYNPGIYTVQRNKYTKCRSLIAYLRCFNVLNVFSKRLIVNTPGIDLQNVTFDDNNEPYDQAIEALFKMTGPPNGTKKNILIIDDTGVDFGPLLCGWFLMSRFKYDVDTVCEYLNNKSTELDQWYTDKLYDWADSREKEKNNICI